MATFPTEKDLILSGQWPYFPILPMKRVQPGTVSFETVELGLMLAGEWNRIYQGNLLRLVLTTPDIRQIVAANRRYPYQEYADLDAVLAAGWLDMLPAVNDGDSGEQFPVPVTLCAARREFVGLVFAHINPPFGGFYSDCLANQRIPPGLMLFAGV